jgi:hypothetical protein
MQHDETVVPGSQQAMNIGHGSGTAAGHADRGPYPEVDEDQ